jgi:hypothetical protein
VPLVQREDTYRPGTLGREHDDAGRADSPREAFDQSAGTWLRRVALAGFGATAEALYPDNAIGAPSWRDAEMVARASQLWEELPPLSRLLLEGLYAGLEVGGAALVPGVGPLSRQSVARRYAMFARLKRSRLFPLRFLAEAVKSSSTMIYMSHPAVIRYLGISKACGHPADGHLGMPVRRDAFAKFLPKATVAAAPAALQASPGEGAPSAKEAS